MAQNSSPEAAGQPLVSFIVPVYKVAAYLPACVDSILAQQGASFEVILVDDGSPDESGQICDDYAEKDARVRVIHQENAGPAMARAAGMGAARATWLAFVDADDWLDADALDTCLPYLTDACDLLLFGTRDVSVRASVEHPLCRAVRTFSRQELPALELYVFDRTAVPAGCLADHLMGSSCNKLYRRDFLARNGVSFEPGYHDEDVLFVAQVLHAVPRATAIPAVLYNYRQREDSSMRGCKPGVRKQIEPQVRRINGYLAQAHPGDAAFARAGQLRALTAFLHLMVLDYVHPNNPAPYAQRKADFLDARRASVFGDPLKDIELVRSLPFQRRILAQLCRLRLFALANLANRLRVGAHILKKGETV